MTARPQTIFRRVHTHNFTVIANAVLNDNRLSLDEKGFLCWLLSRPPDWEVIPTACQKALGIGRSAFYRLAGRLREIGYVKRERVRAADGTIVRVQYTIYDVIDPALPTETQPCDDFPEVDENPGAPVLDSPLVDKPDAGINNDYIINNPPTPQAGENVKPPQAIEEAKPRFSALRNQWPPDHILSATAAERSFLRMRPEQQRQAIELAKAYLADIRTRGWKICDLTKYLRDKRFERLSSPVAAAAVPIKGGTPQAYRWLEYQQAIGKPRAYMAECFRTGKPWYAPTEWPPAMPKSTGPPSPLTEEPGAELARELDQ